MSAEVGYFVLLVSLGLMSTNIVAYRGLRIGHLQFNMIATFFCIGASYIMLTLAFIYNDFSVAYVSKLSSTRLSDMYRYTAVWGGHEGSFLLWIFILSAWGAWVACKSNINTLVMKKMFFILSLVGLALVGFLVFSSDPFVRNVPLSPVDGLELNPLLQDFGFIIHPPILYIGYVGQSVVFALVLAHFMSNALDKASAFLIRRYALMSWGFLTLGITLGSWWAYRELGWGGWWFWDPVENASLLPWLSATVFIHLLNGYIHQGHYKNTLVLFSIFSFLLSLLATFLVRSGLLTSVHAFVSDPNRGVHLLMIIATAGVLSAWAYTRFYKPDAPIRFKINSNAFFIMLQALLVTVLLFCVALGTFYPLLIEMLGFESISVGANYFNTVLLPIVIPALCVMGWFHSRVYPKLILISLSALLAFVTLMVSFKQIMIMPLFGVSLGYWVILTAVKQSYILAQRRRLLLQTSMLLAHIGIGLLGIGVSVVSYYSIEKHIKVHQGETIQLGAYQIVYRTMMTEDVQNYQSKAVLFDINDYGQLLSEKRFYTTSKMVMTDAGVLTLGLSDIYIALGEQLTDQVWSMRVQYKPWIRLIWLSGLLMSLAGFLWSMKRYEN